MNMTRSIRNVVFGALATLGMAGVASAQWVTFDPTNLVQNDVAALDSLKSNINEAQQIANQIQQYRNMLQNTESLAPDQWKSAASSLQQLADIVQQGDGIAYSMKNLDSAFKNRFPGYQSSNDMGGSYETWSNSSLDSIRGAMDSAHAQSTSITDESSALANLRAMADGSSGQKAALDAGNRIAVMQVEQTQKLRQLVMAQMQQQGAYMATQVQAGAATKANEAAVSGYTDPRQGITYKPASIQAPSSSN